MPKAVDSLALYEKALSRKISIAPGPIFSPRGGFKNCVRLNCSMKWSGELDHALRALGELTQ
jgi:DNA-binding transcriptional MocR family regulator